MVNICVKALPPTVASFNCFLLPLDICDTRPVETACYYQVPVKFGLVDDFVNVNILVEWFKYACGMARWVAIWGLDYASYPRLPDP